MIDANETILDQIDNLMPSGAMVDTSALCMPWGVSREPHMYHVSLTIDPQGFSLDHKIMKPITKDPFGTSEASRGSLQIFRRL